MKIGMISFISLFFILAMTSCSFDPQKNSSANMDSQPEAENANNVIFYGQMAGIAFDEMTMPVVLCGSSETSYARMSDKARATQLNNLVANHNRVWVKMRLIHPEWFKGRVTKFEIVEFGVITKTEPAPCDCEKEESTLPVPPVVETPAPVVKKSAPVKDEPKPVVKKDVTAKDIRPCFTAKEYEVTTIITEKGRVISKTTTNLGEAIDASAPDGPEVDAGE